MVCEEEYELLEQIGRGSYGKVYRAQHDSGEVHAIKVVELEAAEDDLDNIQQEIKMLQAFNCPQLTRYHGSFIVGSALWISMEYLEGGSLQELIKTSKTNLDEHSVQWILREMLKALVYLHSERKIHRDVKAGNILVASDGSVRLADFGESVQLTHSIAKRQTFAGSPYWMAPEVIMAQDTYNSKADIWSLGVTAIEMIKGRPPYSEMHPMKAVLCIPNNPPPTLGKDGHYSKHFHTFLEQCFQRDPNLRPSAHDLLKHPFMKAARPTDVLSKLLEARRAAEMMKTLFAGGGDGGAGILNSTAPPLDATHKAKTTTLPASAAAAIAAAQAAAGNGAKGGNTLDSSFDPKTASVEWDFGDGDGDGDGDDGFAQAASLAAAGLGDFDFRSPRAAAAGGGGGAGGVSPGGGVCPPSPGAVTPKARGGSGGMWLEHTPEADKGDAATATALKGPPPLAERQRRRGKMAKVGHLLGIDDAAGAATLQAEMTVLARQQDEELVRRQKVAGLGSWGSSKSGGVTPTSMINSKDSRKPSTSPPSPFSPQQLQQQQQPRGPSLLLGKAGGGRNTSYASSGIASPTPSSAATAALTPANVSSRETTTMPHGSSLASASATTTSRGGPPVDGGVSPPTDGTGGGDGDGGGGGTARPHTASHDIAAQDGGALREATAMAAAAAVAAAEGRGDSASGGGGMPKQPSQDLSESGLETGGGGGGQSEGRPSPANPRPPSSASDSVSWPALPPMRWAADEDGDEAPRDQTDGGGGDKDKGKEAAMHGIKATEVAELLPQRAVPLRTRRSWEQDDVGDLAEHDNGAGAQTRLLGGTVAAAAAIPAGEREGDKSTQKSADAEQPRRGEGTSGADGSGSSNGATNAQGGSASCSVPPQDVVEDGAVQAAAESGSSPSASPTGTEGREGDAFSGTQDSGQLSLPPLSPAVATVPGATTSTPETVPGSGALAGGNAAETGGAHVASQSSLGMPWGTCGFGNTSESPGGGSVKSTSAVLGVGTSEAPREIGVGGAVVVDDGDWNSVDSEEEEEEEAQEVAEAEKRSEGEEAAGAAAAAAAAIVERGDGISNAELTSSGHENQSHPGSDAPASPSSAAREPLEAGSTSNSTPPEASGNDVAAGAVAAEDGAAVVVEEGEAGGAAAVPRDAGEEEDRLTTAFHAHLTPVLCELWDATEDGSAQRQAVQDLAMALERLDGCGNGELTLDFVGAVAKSWPGGAS